MEQSGRKTTGVPRVWTKQHFVTRPRSHEGRCERSLICAVMYSLFYTTRSEMPAFDWLRAVVLQLNLKHQHVKIANRLRIVV